MKNNLALLVTTAVLVSSMAGCATSPETGEKADIADGYTACTEPRPEICTMQYDPVCAQLEDGASKTYASDCSACSDPLVIGYSRGECSSAD